MYQSYSVNNMPKPINTRHEPPAEDTHKRKSVRDTETRADSVPRTAPKGSRPANVRHGAPLPFIGKLKTDDLILLAVIFLLLAEDSDDKLLLLALAYVFFADYFDKYM